MCWWSRHLRSTRLITVNTIDNHNGSWSIVKVQKKRHIGCWCMKPKWKRRRDVAYQRWEEVHQTYRNDPWATGIRMRETILISHPVMRIRRISKAQFRAKIKVTDTECLDFSVSDGCSGDFQQCARQVLRHCAVPNRWTASNEAPSVRLYQNVRATIRQKDVISIEYR